MKRALAIFSILAFAAAPMFTSDQWNSKTITVTAGTAIRVVNNSVRVDSILVQMLTGGSGRGYVLNSNPQNTCTKGAAGTAFVAELGAASATSPGASATIPSNGSAANTQGGLDLQYFCVDGSNSGDTILVSWNPR